MDHAVSKNKKRNIFSILATLCLMTGCIINPKQDITRSNQTYFSHSTPNVAYPSRSTTIQHGKTTNRNAISRPATALILHFDNDSAAVRREDIERLQSFLLNFPSNQMPIFLITGHTDNNHSDVYNIRLSERRAKSIQSQMVIMGVPITQTAIRGLGESNPLASNTSDDGRQSNRRVTVQVID